MTETQLALLRDIAEGQLFFSPKGNSIEEYSAFQTVADALARLEALGYIRKCELRYESKTGRRFIDQVVVRNGLTALGRKFVR
jgi:hypothetical protein